MTTTPNSTDRFRKGFVLALTIACTFGFIAMLSAFLKALFLAAVFSGMAYPLYLWFSWVLRGRDTLASLMTLVILLFVIILPMIFLLWIVADQAIEVTEAVKPWMKEQYSESAQRGHTLPDWVPFADKLEPYRAGITAKLAQFAGKTSSFLASNLARLSEGTVVFFLNLFIMLYAMFCFLISGPLILKKIMHYVPLLQNDKEKIIQVGLSVSRATVKGTLVIGIIQGALAGLGFAVAGIDAAVFWGVIVVVLSIIPGIGPTLIWVPAVAYLLMSDQTIAGIGLLVWSAGIVGTIDNLLRPILVGRDAKMPDLLVLLSTLGGLTLFGASGLVIGPVLAALFLTILTIYTQVFADWLEPDQQPEVP